MKIFQVAQWNKRENSCLFYLISMVLLDNAPHFTYRQCFFFYISIRIYNFILIIDYSHSERPHMAPEIDRLYWQLWTHSSMTLWYYRPVISIGKLFFLSCIWLRRNSKRGERKRKHSRNNKVCLRLKLQYLKYYLAFFKRLDLSYI